MSGAHGADEQVDRLDNGLIVATESMTGVSSVALGAWVASGSRDEPSECSGASHFLEHLLFKGTSRRPGPSIAEALDQIGGDCNAYTTKENTAFYVRLLAEDADIGFDILCDILEDPLLQESDIDAERGVILDEILAHNDEPGEVAVEAAFDSLFPHHPLGRDTLGKQSSIEGLERDRIVDFFDHHYRPGNMVVAVAGDIAHDEVRERISGRLDARPGGSRPERQVPTSADRNVLAIERPTEQAQLVLAIRTSGYLDPGRYRLAVYSQILGGGLSSRLFRRVREERGLAYSIWTERVHYSDSGVLYVTAGTHPRHVDDVIEIVLEEFDALARGEATDKEISISKSNLRADLLLASEDSGSRLHRLGGSVLAYDRVVPTSESLACIEAVTPPDVQAVGEMLGSAPRSLVVVGPLDAARFEARWAEL